MIPKGLRNCILATTFALLWGGLPATTSAFQAPIDTNLVAYLNPPCGPRALAPNLVAHQGSLYLTWVQLKPSPVNLRDGEHSTAETPRDRPRPRIWQYRWSKWSADQGWTAPITIEQSTQIVANWADFPGLQFLENSSAGNMLAFYPEKSGGASPYAYDVVLKSSEDGGQTWIRQGRPHDDLTPTEHGFCTIIRDDAEGSGAYLFWLDGRAMAGGHGDSAGGMSLRTARFANGRISESTVLDLRTCECCSTDAAMTDAGPVVVYRDRDGDEIRDISIVRLVNGTWTQPATVHADAWVMPGCPVNGPTAAADGALLAVAWYTAAGGDGTVKVAFSDDNGASFGEAIVIDNADAGAAPLGRVDVVLDPQTGAAIVSWLDKDDTPNTSSNPDYDRGGAVIRVCRVQANGSVSEPINVAITSPARASGFPIMVRDGSNLVFAYTEDTEPLTIQVARIKISDLRK